MLAECGERMYICSASETERKEQQSVKVLVTGATGYIGGSVATGLLEAGHEVHGLVRSDARALQAREKGIMPVVGTLNDARLLADAASESDAVVNAANADHRGAVEAILEGLAGTGRPLLHTSGSSIVGTRSAGELVDDVYHEETPLRPSPARAERVALNLDILAATEKGVRTVVICPSLIYGRGKGDEPHSMQVPWLIELARKEGVAKHIGSGSNIWSNVHIDDLVDLYLLALAKAPPGAFYFAENGENSMREVCEAISRSLGFDGTTASMTVKEAAAEWGDGAANDTMGSNSRVRAVRARTELGWSPKAPPLLEEIEHGCYAGWPAAN